MNTNSLGVLGLACLLLAPGEASPRPGPARLGAFEELSLHIEVDLPSPDFRWPGHALPLAAISGLAAEVVLELETDEPLASLRLLRGTREVLALGSAPESRLGIHELSLEAEGGTLAQLLEAYPPGDYEVEALTLAGDRLRGTARLGAAFPGPFRVLSPAAGDVLPPGDVLLTWSPARSAACYVLEIEQEQSGFSLELRMQPGERRCVIPAQVLRAGETYDYSLTVQGDNDNELELEGRFVAPRAGRAATSR